METKFVKMDLNYDNPSWYTGLLFSSEKFDVYEKAAWMKKNWTWSVYASIVYIIFIYLGQEWMKTRKPFNLKHTLAAWNFGLAIFSFIGCSAVFPELVRICSNYGVYQSVCGTPEIASESSLYWGYLFVLSKMLELGDTAFIILRKRKLIFLHWYHHISVLICVWLSSKNLMSTGAWFCTVNYMVHAVMYSYYGLTTLGVKVPKIMAMTITALQLNQMVVGLAVNVYAQRIKMAGTECAVTDFHIWMVYGMYFSYLVLFGNFFYKTYFCSGKEKVKSKEN